MTVSRYPNPSNLSELSQVWMPLDGPTLHERFWTPEQAAKAWGCSLSTAYRLILTNGERLGRRVVAQLWPDKVRFVTMIRAGAAKPAARRGNPAFADSAFQSANACAREARKRAK